MFSWNRCFPWLLSFASPLFSSSFTVLCGHASGIVGSSEPRPVIPQRDSSRPSHSPSASALLSKQISAGPILLSTEAAQRRGTVMAHLCWLWNSDGAVRGTAGSQRGRRSRLLFGIRSARPPHLLCSEPANSFIWVISGENVTNLCRNCCNWISAAGMMRREALSGMRAGAASRWRANVVILERLSDTGDESDHKPLNILEKGWNRPALLIFTLI